MSEQGTWQDYDSASKFRQWLIRQVDRRIAKLRPPPRFGEVISIDPDTNTCQVIFVGEDVQSTVRMWGVIPSTPGQKVMVDGPESFRYISQVR